jgi:signal transduction histidine kinase
MQNGSEAEVAIVGHEGLIGVTALLGGTDIPWNEATVQIGGQALRVPLEALRHEAGRSGRLRLLLQRYAQALLVQTAQTAACNRFHSIEQRLGRCLLALQDRVQRDDIAITHERLATVLGSMRPGVTLAALHLQNQEIIRYTRGKITVVDRHRLAEVACECYETVCLEHERLLGQEALQKLGSDAELADEMLREMNSRLMVAAIREQRAREAAEDAHDTATRFFATLSHELRTPLTAILGWSDILQSREHVDDATLELAIDTIRRNAEAQKQLVNDMLDLSRLRSGQVRLNLAPIDVAAAVRDAVASTRPAADANGIAVTVLTGEPVTIHADPFRLQQILTNLLTNAIKFTPPAGTIVITTTPSESQVEIAVRDSGVGIEPELLPHVLEPFRQGAAAASAQIGLGLGLAIVHQLVTLHGGSVEVQSSGSERGATVAIVLPSGGEARHPRRPPAPDPRAVDRYGG